MFDRSKDSLKMKSISRRRENLPKGFHEAHGQESGLMPGSFGNRGSNGPVLDTRGNPLYSTRTQRAVARNGHPADKKFPWLISSPSRRVSAAVTAAPRECVEWASFQIRNKGTPKTHRAAPCGGSFVLGLTNLFNPERGLFRQIAKRQLLVISNSNFKALQGVQDGHTDDATLKYKRQR